MAALTVCAWQWGTKYGPHYVTRLRNGVARHLRQPHEFRIFHPEPEDHLLTEIPGCLCRLRMFDPEWQRRNGITGRLLCLDLDLIITGEMEPILSLTDAPFAILKGANASNPCPFNGSVMMIEAGYRPDVWTDFSLHAIAAVPFHDFPDDQGWLWHKLPDADGLPVGPASGIYAFQKPGWPGGHALPKDARIVCFPGWRDPSRFTFLPWVAEHWK